MARRFSSDDQIGDSRTRHLESLCDHKNRTEKESSPDPQLREISLKQLTRALFDPRLLVELLEILVPPNCSYEKTESGTVDLIEIINNNFRKITGGA
ncbi:MAG: hypothetical protein M2R45_02517 [Verrucomicrobia subdivision 3 bacterium]|nr:hypothetical protein [Limisphaerales bacterium]MCS1414276.1 hypothetical protein [Limisphaerales bacterium]